MTVSDTGAPVWLVVGLGNPGPAYAGHRHNVGYLVADELANRMGEKFRAHKSGRADVVEGRLGEPGTPGPRVVLARPRCYMNESGGPVKALATFYKVPAERIVAIHDELDIGFGTLRDKLGVSVNVPENADLRFGSLHRIPSARPSYAFSSVTPIIAPSIELNGVNHFIAPHPAVW